MLLLAVGLLAGCQGAGVDPNDETVSTECYVEGLYKVTSQRPISCRNMSVNVAIARDMMIERKWVADEAEFNKLYARVEVDIVDRKCIVGPSILQWIPLPGCLYGQYSVNSNTKYRNPNIVVDEPVAYIELNWDAGGLAHEMMHHYDATHGRADVTSTHDFWTSLGYFSYANDYVLSALSLN